MTALPISPKYREALKVSLLTQLLATVFLLTILDGGTLAKAGGAVMIAFWLGVAGVIFRRPAAPKTLDLLYVRWGYLPMLVVGIVVAGLMSTLRS